MDDDERLGIFRSRPPLMANLPWRAGRPAFLPAVLLVIACLSGGCESGSAPATGGDAGSTTSPLLQKWCSQCHAPPRPEMHTAREWPGVLAQMQQHRISQGLGKIGNQDLQDLLDYLQSHARPPSAS